MDPIRAKKIFFFKIAFLIFFAQRTRDWASHNYFNL